MADAVSRSGETCQTDNLQATQKNSRIQENIDGEGTRFILWLFEGPHRELILNPLFQLLQAATDNVLLESQQRKKWRNVIRPFIADSSVETSPVDFARVTTAIASAYILSHRNKPQAMLSIKVYSTKRSAYNAFCKKYGFIQSQQFQREQYNFMADLKRKLALNNNSETNRERKQSMSLELYSSFNRWFLEENDRTSAFARAFMCLTWACSSHATATDSICLQNLVWKVDGCKLVLSHVKDDNQGNTEPRYVHCNPGNPLICPIIAVFEYLCINPEILHEPNGRLFPGSICQEKRFGQILQKMAFKHPRDVVRMGYILDEICVANLRQDETTKNDSGTILTASRATELRGAYVLYQRTGNRFAGRILSGLDKISHMFTASNPDFYPIDPSEPTGYTSQQQDLVDIEVKGVLASLFGEGNYASIYPFLRVGLASFLMAKKSFQDINPKTGGQASLTALFQSQQVDTISKYAFARLPRDPINGGEIVRVTGILPATMVLFSMQELKRDIQSMVPAQSGDRATEAEDRVRAIIADGVRTFQESLNQETQPEPTNRENVSSLAVAVEDGRWKSWLHDDGVHRRIPPNWNVPKCSLETAYVWWHCGDETTEISPVKLLQSVDVKGMTRGTKRLEEFRFIMRMLDKKADSLGFALTDNPTRQVVISAYAASKSFLGISEITPTGKRRIIDTLSWSSIPKLMPTAKRSRTIAKK